MTPSPTPQLRKWTAVATDYLGYADPTATEAIANVLRDETAHDGRDPHIAQDLADACLPPPEDTEWNLRMMPRDEDGERLGVPPDMEVGPYGLVPNRPLTNGQAAQVIYQMALAHQWAA